VEVEARPATTDRVATLKASLEQGRRQHREHVREGELIQHPSLHGSLDLKNIGTPIR
jgi:hypothetical protein